MQRLARLWPALLLPIAAVWWRQRQQLASMSTRFEQAEAKLHELDSRPNVLLALRNSVEPPPLELPLFDEPKLFDASISSMYGLPIVQPAFPFVVKGDLT